MDEFTYQVERWPDVVDEARPLWDLHWQEVALDRERIPLDPDFALYAQLDAMDQLHIVTVRDAGQTLVGYHASIVRPHPHYRTSLSAFTDLYYLLPPCRKGMVGVRLFREVERTLRARGVEKASVQTKVSLDMSRIFERLGWRLTEKVYTKYLKD
jgi:GNAT superfamily N-acetyltransferase